MALLNDVGKFSWPEVIEKAEKALDILSVSAGQSYELAKLDAQAERFLWRWDGTRFHVDVFLVWSLRAPLTLLTAHVDDGPPVDAASNPRYHQGMRYFRCSQTAGNIGLAFQYLFLALESLLAAKHPKPKNLYELDWLKQALGVEEQSYLTSGRAAVKARGGAAADIDHIYQVRLALFHAKPERQPIVPLDPSAEPRIREAYWRLATHVLELLRSYDVWPRGQTLVTEPEVNEQGEFMHNLDRVGLMHEREEAGTSTARVVSSIRSPDKMPSFVVEWDFPNGIPKSLRGFTWRFGPIPTQRFLSVVVTTTRPTTLRIHLQIDGGMQHVMRG